MTWGRGPQSLMETDKEVSVRIQSITLRRMGAPSQPAPEHPEEIRAEMKFERQRGWSVENIPGRAACGAAHIPLAPGGSCRTVWSLSGEGWPLGQVGPVWAGGCGAGPFGPSFPFREVVVFVFRLSTLSPVEIWMLQVQVVKHKPLKYNTIFVSLFGTFFNLQEA